MSRRYTVDDLLKLRVSPLICKPTNLPPVEEWMGVQEATSRRLTAGRGKQDDIQAESFLKRSALLEGSNNRKAVSGTEDIVLGPQRRSFASANARAPGKGSGSKEEEEEGGSNDRQTHQERHTSGGDASGRENERKDGRYVANGGRRTDRDEKEDWQTARNGRRHDSEDWESKGRRFGDRERDRPRWGAREVKDDQQPSEERPQDGDDDGKRAFRRDGNTRAKFEQPWGRSERTTGHGDEVRKNTPGRPEWRRDRGRDRDWPAQVEADPEWMDSTATGTEEPTQTRTAEDLRKWLESKKPSGSKQTPDRGMLDDALEETNIAGGSIVLEKPRVTTIQQDIDATDKFFAKFNDQKPTDQVGSQVKAPTKTRFASLFSPPPEEAAKEPPPAHPKTEEKDRKPTPTQVPVAMDAEQLAFQQMLQKLTARSTNGTPQTRIPPKSRNSMHGSQEHEEIEGRRQSSDLAHLQRQDGRHPLNATSELERLISSRSPAMDAHIRHASTPSKESELLLNLMKQASIAREPGQPQAPPSEQRHQPGMFPMMDAMNRSAATQNMHAGGGAGRLVSPQQREGMLGAYFDDAAISTMRHVPQQTPREAMQRDAIPRDAMPRRPTNGPMPPSFEDTYLQNLFQNRSQPHIQSPAGQSQMQGLPPGLQRPPVFDQVPRPPPGWQSQQQPPPPQPQHQQHQQHQQARQPPPGMPNVPQNRGMPPPPYGGMQYPPNMPPPQMQPGQPRPRTYTGDSGPGPGYPPPGMGPPPGFMNSGPPPGFPGMPPSMSRLGDQYGGGQRSSRNVMELYGSGNGSADRRGLQNGAGAMSGGYR